MANFGQYEGHRILSNAMNKTVDRAARRYEFNEQQRMQNARDRMDQEKFAEQRRQFNVQDEYNRENQEQKNWAYGVMQEEQRNKVLKKDLENQLMSNIRPDEYNFMTEDGFLKSPDEIKQILSAPLDKAYIQDLTDLDPEGGLSLTDKKNMSTNVSKLHAQRVFDEMVGQFKQAGLDEDDIMEHLEANNLTEYMDDFMIRAMGVKPEDITSTSSPLLRAMYKNTYDNTALGSASGYGIDSYRYDDKSKSKGQEKLILKALEKFGKSREGGKNWYFNESDDIKVSQGDDGSWKLTESDFFKDDEFDIEFDKKGPYVSGGTFGKKIYLNNSEQFEDLEDLLELQ